LTVWYESAASRFRQAQLSNGAVQSLLIPVYSLTLELLWRI